MFLTILLVVLVFMQAPATWEATYQRGQQLLLDRKTADAIKLFEGAVKASPGFDGAHYALADAHRMAALDAAIGGPSQDAARRRHLEAAAAHYRRAAERKGDYRQLAVGQLMNVYGKDDLDQPNEVVTFARQYVELSPSSPVGHIMLARALTATGQEAGATTALLRARTAVPPDESRLLAVSIVDHVVESAATPTADLKALLDYADGVIDRELKADPRDRGLIMAKGATALLRAQRLETDPARKRALEAESSRQLDRLRELNAARPSPAPAEPVLPTEPAGYTAARSRAEGMVSRKQFSEAAGVYETFVKSHPAFVPPHYLRLKALVLAGQRAAIEPGLKAARQAIPTAPEMRYMAATYLFDIVNTNKSIAPADAKTLLADAIVLLDEALKARPDYLEAVVYQVRRHQDPRQVRNGSGSDQGAHH